MNLLLKKPYITINLIINFMLNLKERVIDLFMIIYLIIFVGLKGESSTRCEAVKSIGSVTKHKLTQISVKLSTFQKVWRIYLPRFVYYAVAHVKVSTSAAVVLCVI